MAIESSGHSQGNPRMFALIEGAPKTGPSPTIWAWPQITEYLKVAGQPVAGPWPPHQEPRPDPEDEAGPVAVAEDRPTRTGSAPAPATSPHPGSVAARPTPRYPRRRPRL